MSLKVIKHGIAIIGMAILAILSIASGASSPEVQSEEQKLEEERKRLENVLSKPVNLTVNNSTTWIEAVGGIRNGGDEKAYIITIIGNISIPPSTDITFGSVRNVRISIEGTGSLSLTGNGKMLYIGGGQEVIVKDITLQGRDSNTDAVVVIEADYESFIFDRLYIKPIFRMRGRAIITGNEAINRTYIANPQPLGGVRIDYGIFSMHDNSSVTGNKCGGVRNYGGTITMYDNASVANNTGGGGVFFSDWGGSLTMRGNASITANSGRGVSVSGGLYMFDNASVTNNTGGGVYVGGIFTMEGGNISGNTTTGDGGGVYYSYISNNADYIFTMKGGIISGNTARNGGGLFLGDRTKFVNNGGTIYGNDATQNLKNTSTNRGHSVCQGNVSNWRNATVVSPMSSESYGFWTND